MIHIITTEEAFTTPVGSKRLMNVTRVKLLGITLVKITKSF